MKTILKNAFHNESRFRKGLEVVVTSDIPAGSGLGSSAAISVATAAAALKFSGSDIGSKAIFELAMLGEKQVHGNPSGIDVETSLSGGLLLFSRKNGPKAIPLDRMVQILIVYSGKPRRTSELIRRVAQRKKQFPNFFNCLTEAASFLSLDVVDALASGDLPRLGALMNVSQTTLSWIGVANPTIDKVIEEIAQRDVYGVKLTGAGGGGSVIALPKPETIDAVMKFISRKYATSFVTDIPHEGLRWES
jgi:mevalonate kinase